jgi:hypothetical protein
MQIDGNSGNDEVTLDPFKPFTEASSFVRFPQIGEANPNLIIDDPLENVSGSGVFAGSGVNVFLEEIPTPSQIADIARQAAYFTLQTGVFYAFESNILTGERAMANDISLLN